METQCVIPSSFVTKPGLGDRSQQFRHEKVQMVGTLNWVEEGSLVSVGRAEYFFPKVFIKGDKAS